MSLRALLFSIAVFSTQCQAQTTGYGCTIVAKSDVNDSYMNPVCLNVCNDTYPFNFYGATSTGYNCTPPPASGANYPSALESSNTACSCNCVGCTEENQCIQEVYKETKEKQRDVKKEK